MLPKGDGQVEMRANASPECLALLYELSAYTLNKGDAEFLHQLVVDAYGAQHLTPESKPIQGAFTLAGLCIVAERGGTGRQGQLAHIALAKLTKDWPRFLPATHPGAVTVADVMAEPAGAARDSRLHDWAVSVWESYAAEHERVRAVLGMLDNAGGVYWPA